ncbi:hypothetical protein [Blastococcus brunescens]|uniref:Uncharacterized protein n=1 Tax=Blastococcus brunescens TaxID=1564165 RepID=A0ABZ1AUD3_9ACTN|nr:hypothetical protein [Blastococcus sp. BMG 8361]WRL62187.1 hypothetical protein U6N30_19330 [Blastococcus sp. BMG 8361]
MSLVRGWSAEIGIALACAIWAVLFLTEPVQALVLGPATVVTVVPFRRRPLLAGLALIALEAIAWAVGVPPENAALLPPLLVVAFALRRYDTGRWGLAVLATVAAAGVARDPSIPDLIFVGIVVGGTAAFGAAIRRREREARTAQDTAAELRAQDPAEVARRVVAEERSRLAGETLDVVRQAVRTMRAHAGAAEQSLSSPDLEAVGIVGRRAVAELRRLLGLLREEAPAPRPPEEQSRSGNRAGWVDVGSAAALAALAAIEAIALTSAGEIPETGVLGLLLVAAVGGCVALRRVDAALACLLAALPGGGVGRRVPAAREHRQHGGVGVAVLVGGCGRPPVDPRGVGRAGRDHHGRHLPARRGQRAHHRGDVRGARRRRAAVDVPRPGRPGGRGHRDQPRGHAAGDVGARNPGRAAAAGARTA